MNFKCPACAGKGWWRYSDHRFHASELQECPIAVCPLCVGTGLEPKHPEFQPTRPPSHYARHSPSWCLNSAFPATDGHMPCTTMGEILRHLVKTGDAWRLCPVDEFDSDKHVQFWARKILPWSHESRRVATFCREWRQVFEWEDADAMSMKRLALEVRKGDVKARWLSEEEKTIMLLPTAT